MGEEKDRVKAKGVGRNSERAARGRYAWAGFDAGVSQLRNVAIRYRPVRKRYKYWAPGSRYPL